MSRTNRRRGRERCRQVGPFLVLCLSAGLLAHAPQGPQPAPGPSRNPLDVARVLAARYPAAPSMSYIPALSWAGALRVTTLTGEPQFAERARLQMRPFLSGEKPPIAEPYLLTSLAGHLAFADLAALDGDAAAAALARKGADFILPDDNGRAVEGATLVAPFPSTGGTKVPPSENIVRFPRRWTDDMFMSSSILSRVGGRSDDPRYAATVGRLLTTYADRLQRPDGLFIHATDGPFAWGRGNGFAAWGLTDALTYLPGTWADRPRVLEIYRRQMRGLLAHQAEDGMWRQVVDEPTSYRELTVTAMTIAAMARGVRLEWLDRSFVPAIDRAWAALLTRIGPDGSVADVCSGTGAGPTKEYYLNRPAVSGGDDRGGAMALVAAIEMEELRRR